MRNTPYAAVVAVPAVLLLCWGAALFWRDSPTGALVAVAIGAALLLGAYRIARADSFSPTKAKHWDATRSTGVNKWLDDQAAAADDRRAGKP